MWRGVVFAAGVLTTALALYVYRMLFIPPVTLVELPQVYGSAACVDTVMFTYKTELYNLPNGMRSTLVGWARFQPQLALVYLGDVAGEEFMGAHFGELGSGCFRKLVSGAHRADLLRLAWLVVNGGVYCDIDARPTGAMPRLRLAPDDLLLVRDRVIFVGRRAVYNAFMAVGRPRHPLFVEVLRRTLRLISKNDLGDVRKIVGRGGGLMKASVRNLLCFGGPLMVGDVFCDMYGESSLEAGYKKLNDGTLLQMWGFTVSNYVTDPSGNAIMTTTYDGHKVEASSVRWNDITVETVFK
jgi:hypothetical protein